MTAPGLFRSLPGRVTRNRKAAQSGRQRRFALVAGLAVLLAAVAQACSVPVFRYALDHWTPDAYRLYVFHKGELTADQRQQIDRLVTPDQAAYTNVKVELVDVAQPLTKMHEQIWQANTTDTLPHCVLHQPTMQKGVYRQALTGSLEESADWQLTDSPLRKHITQQLLGGTSAVWVYLDSTSGEGDDERFVETETLLKQLEGELKLPEIEPEDLPELATAPESLKLKFDIVRLSRDTPEEAALIEMLLTTEADLRDEDLKDQAMLFPVFGRGRVLYSLVGAGINDATIGDAARFVVGACQCTVKAENPGVDLLMAVDWDQLVRPTGPVEVDVPLTGLAAFEADDDAESQLASVAGSTGNASTAQLEPSEVDSSKSAIVADTEHSSSEGITVAQPELSQDEPTLAVSTWLIVGVLALVIGAVGCVALPKR